MSERYNMTARTRYIYRVGVYSTSAFQISFQFQPKIHGFRSIFWLRACHFYPQIKRSDHIRPKDSYIDDRW